MSMASKPVVSVVCVVYNQEQYISQAIESFLCQETNFCYEIVIHDDASTDRTSDVINRYCEQYPGRIKYVRQPKNVYSQGARIFDTAIAFSSGSLLLSVRVMTFGRTRKSCSFNMITWWPTLTWAQCSVMQMFITRHRE